MRWGGGRKRRGGRGAKGEGEEKGGERRKREGGEGKGGEGGGGGGGGSGTGRIGVPWHDNSRYAGRPNRRRRIRIRQLPAVNRLAECPGAGGLALCCEPRRVGRDMLVGLLLVERNR